MPYLIHDKIDPARLELNEGPVLIVIHGTGSSAGADLEKETGPGWWQPGSDFDRALCARLVNAHGANLSSANVLRFVWSGENSEKQREAAAKSLVQIISAAEAKGHAIAIVAHSHGGNVARRACELAALQGRSSALPPWRVVCMATPFFHYALADALKRALVATLFMFLSAAGSFWLTFPNVGVGSDIDVAAAAVGGVLMIFAIFYLFACIRAWRELDLPRYRMTSRFRNYAKFHNLVAGRDEAIGLLRSFNQSIRLVRQLNPTWWVAGPIKWYLVATTGAFLLTVTFITVAKVRDGSFNFFEFFFFLFNVTLLGLSVIVAIRIVYILHWCIDHYISGRLRNLAYGNDAGIPMKAVETYPWPGNEDATMVLDEVAEAAVADHIERATAGFYAKLHESLEPHKSLFAQDMGAITQRVLTGDELAHNVCYRVEPFIDIVAELLTRGGHWRLAK